MGQEIRDRRRIRTREEVPWTQGRDRSGAHREREAVDAESFYVGAMEGKAVRALEGTFELAGSMTAFSKAQFRRLVARSKKEKI